MPIFVVNLNVAFVQQKKNSGYLCVDGRDGIYALPYNRYTETGYMHINKSGSENVLFPFIR